MGDGVGEAGEPAGGSRRTPPRPGRRRRPRERRNDAGEIAGKAADRPHDERWRPRGAIEVGALTGILAGANPPSPRAEPRDREDQSNGRPASGLSAGRARGGRAAILGTLASMVVEFISLSGPSPGVAAALVVALCDHPRLARGDPHLPPKPTAVFLPGPRRPLAPALTPLRRRVLIAQPSHSVSPVGDQ